MISRILWCGMLSMIALVCYGVQLDRQTEKEPALAPTVPEIARSSAQRVIAAYALDGDDPAAALKEAERLVRRRPLPAEHLRILAQAQFMAGDTEQSALTIQYAAQRGWRDGLAQESMLRLAADAGDDAEAARRYTALFLRRSTQEALLEEFGQIVLAEPGGEGRQTLITIVGGAERWHNQFLRRGPRVLPPDAFVEIVSATAEQGADFDCAVLREAQPAIVSRDAQAGQRLAQVIDQNC
ncbi:MAG: hypothetical protein AAF697_10120 [Pseudomonadota bacterium]